MAETVTGQKLREDEWADTETAARLLGLSPGTLVNYRSCKGKKGNGPAWLKVGRRIMYPMSEIDRYLESCLHGGKGYREGVDE